MNNRLRAKVLFFVSMVLLSCVLLSALMIWVHWMFAYLYFPIFLFCAYKIWQVKCPNCGTRAVMRTAQIPILGRVSFAFIFVPEKCSKCGVSFHSTNEPPN